MGLRWKRAVGSGRSVRRFIGRCFGLRRGFGRIVE
jgi:hypothetical protein